MPLRLITGLANAGKTGDVLREALAAAAAGASPVIAVPNLADVRRLEVELSDKAPLGVRVVTLRQLTIELWSLFGDGRRIVDAPTRESLLRRIVARGVPESMDLASRAPGFPRLLVRLAQSTPLNGGGAPDLGEAESALVGLLRDYRDELTGQGLVEQRWLGELISATSPALEGPLGVMRFDVLDAPEVQLLVGLSRENDVTVALTWEHTFAPTRANDGVLEYLAGIASSHVELPDAPAHDEIQRLATALFAGPRGIKIQGEVVLGLASGSEAESALIAQAVADEIADGVDAERIVIAFPRTSRRVDNLRAALLSHGVSAEFDLATPLQSTRFGRSWHALLALAAGRGDRADALTFIASPYSGVNREAVHELDKRWRQNRTGNPGSLLAAISRLGGECEGLINLARAIAERPLSTSTLAQWQKLADAMLASASVESVGGPLRRESAEDVAAYQAIARALAQMVGPASVPLGIADVLSAISTIDVRERGNEAPGRVQVCDFRQVGARRFDVVVLGGLNEDEISLAARESTEELLRDDLTRQLEGELGNRARLGFYSLVSRARRRLYLVRQEADSEGRERRASALWEDVLDAYRPLGAIGDEATGPPLPCRRLARADVEGLAPAMTIGRREARENAEQIRLATLNRGAVGGEAALAALGGATVFSATEIEAYLACPYRWFYERIVRPEEIDEALDARELGTRAHGLLAAFYRRLTAETGHARVTPEWLGEALGLFEDVVAQDRSSVAPSGLSEEMQVARAVGWARNVVGQDAILLPGFVPAHVELGFGDEPPFTFAGHSFRGRIDRVDVSPVSLFVTDYKSSREVTGLEKLESEGKVQAVIYACAAQVALGLPASGSVYRSMRSGHLRGFWRSDLLDSLPAGMCEDDALDAAGFAEVVARTGERVAVAIDGMRAGRIPREPAIKGACTYCGLSSICEGAR